MDALYETLPGSVEHTLAGKKFKLAPWTLGDDAELERRYLANRRRPLDIAREFCKPQEVMVDGQKAHVDVPVDVQKHILGLAFDLECKGMRATSEELAKFNMSPEGQIIEFWLRAVKNHKELTLEDAERIMRASWEEAAAALKKTAEKSGEKALGNPTPPEETPPEVQTPSTDGVSSTERSLKQESTH